MTDDLAAMLDQVRKGGLHLVMAHQHFGHFEENPALKKSILTNARIRVRNPVESERDSGLKTNTIPL
jgi:hypothetical protein